MESESIPSTASPRTIPQLEAMRVAVMHAKLSELIAQKETRLIEIQKIDLQVAQLRVNIQTIFDRNGFKDLPVGGVLAEPSDTLPAGTVLQPNGEPYLST